MVVVIAIWVTAIISLFVGIRVGKRMSDIDKAVERDDYTKYKEN